MPDRIKVEIAYETPHFNSMKTLIIIKMVRFIWTEIGHL